jgi:glycosyltransferase involved in cell wall biosynthesis
VRILIVTPYLPHEHVGHGGGSAVRGMVAELARRHEVCLVSLVRPADAHRIGEVTALGVTVEAVPFIDRSATGLDRLRLVAGRLMAAARATAARYPFYVAKYASGSLDRAACRVAAAWRPDVIQIEYLQLALTLRALRRWRDSAGDDRPRLVLDSHELGSLPRRRRAAGAALPHRAWLALDAAAWDRLARDASGWADTTLCVTEQDRQLYARAGGRRLATVPLGIDVRGLQPARDAGWPRRVLFLGSFQHPPNRAAARLLCQDVWPAAAPRLPGWELVLAGPGSADFLAGLDDVPAGVSATGFVADLDALFRSCSVFAAPLTEGGGIKIKILEALARGIPVVTTPIGAEGIVDRDQDLVAWAEGAGDFADVLVRTADDPGGAGDRALRARRFVEERFAWEAVVGRLEEIYRGGPAEL